MATKNAINSNIPIEISLGGTATTTFSHVDGPVYYDGSGLNSIAIGTAGQILVSNGPGAGATFQTVTGAGASVPIGALEYFCNANGDTYLDPSWILCDGSMLSQSTYSTLYSRIGLVNYGKWLTVTTPNQATFVCYGPGKYLAGSGRFVFTSTDGSTWSAEISTDPDQSITCMAYGNGIYMVGNQGGNTQTSTNGSTWATGVSAFTNGQINRITYGLGKFIAVGSHAQLATSTNGAAWTTVFMDTYDDLSGVATTTNKAVAVGSPHDSWSVPPAVATSTDAVHWFSATPTIGGSYDYSYGPNGGPSLSWDGTKFIGVGYGVGPLTSTNGYDWTALTQNVGAGAAFTSGTAILHEGGLYIEVGQSGALATSSDGITWTQQLTGVGNINTLYHHGSMWLYGADGGTIGTCTDPTSTTFAIHSLTATSSIMGIVNNGAGLSVAIGRVDTGSGYCALATSTNDLTWTAVTSTALTTDMFSLCYGGGKFVAGGGGGAIATSTNGTAWATVSSPTTSIINNVAYLGSKYFYAGCGGALGYSTDAITWTDIAFQDYPVSCIAKSTSTYVVAGPGWVASSATGTSGWSIHTYAYSPFTASTVGAPILRAVTYTNSKFFASDSLSNVISSTDAITWATHTSPYEWNYLGSGFGNVVGSAIHDSGQLGFSSDGITWNYTVEDMGSVDVTTGTDNVVAGTGNNYVRLSYAGTAYDHTTSFMLPTDAGLAITTETASYFNRGLYIKAL